MAKNRRTRGANSASNRLKSSEAPQPSGVPGARVNAPTGNVPRGASRVPVTSRTQSRRQASWLPIVGAVAVVIVVAVIGIYLANRGGDQSSLLGTFQTEEGRTHVAEGSPVQFVANPPTSGNHYPSPAAWGPSSTLLQPGVWVHNLEHGGVALLYDCPAGCPDIVQVGSQAWSTFPKDKFGEVKLIVTAYNGLPNKAQVAAVAWNYSKVYTNDFSLANFRVFYDGHVDRGPEDTP